MLKSGLLSFKQLSAGRPRVQHLSSLDASFLHLETPETPMHVGSLTLLELPDGYAGNFYDDVKAMLINRSNISRIFQHKLAPMPFELADPVWIEDDDVDFDYHIRHVILPKPGTRLQLEALVARLHSSLLDRSRPLWEAYVIEGLEDGKAAYYFKGHHSALDGQSGAELARAIYDLTPEVRVFDAPQRPKRHQYQLGVTEMMEAGVSNAARSYFNLIKALPGCRQGHWLPGEGSGHRWRSEGSPEKPRTSAADPLQRLDHQPAILRHLHGADCRDQGHGKAPWGHVE